MHCWGSTGVHISPKEKPKRSLARSNRSLPQPAQFPPQGTSLSPFSGVRFLGQSVRIRDPLSGVLLLLLEGHACWLKSTCFSRSGLLLATAGYSETLAQSIF